MMIYVNQAVAIFKILSCDINSVAPVKKQTILADRTIEFLLLFKRSDLSEEDYEMFPKGFIDRRSVILRD